MIKLVACEPGLAIVRPVRPEACLGLGYGRKTWRSKGGRPIYIFQ